MVTVEHVEFKKDSRECSLGEKNKSQSVSPGVYAISKGVEEVAGINTISSVLVGYMGIRGAYDAIDRIGKCIENRGWTVISQQG